jgi:hypothetical protein
MPIAVPSLFTLGQTVLGYYRSRFPNRDLGAESFLGKKAGAEAMALYGLFKVVADADADAMPSEMTSTARLDEYAVLYGLSNGKGGFGRKGATAAASGAGNVTYAGAYAYTFVDGTQLTAPDGSTVIQIAADLTFNSAGTLSASLSAVTPGTAGNLAMGPCSGSAT